MNVLLDMVGCRLNQSEIEKFAFQLRSAGYQVVSDASSADIAIVNTCTVTAAAAADSRKMIRKIARAGCHRIIATGCLATIDPNQLMELSSACEIITNQNKDSLVSTIFDSGSKKNSEEQSRKPLPGKNKRTRAFIKVQDGCDNFCTFCITRVARGNSRSIQIKQIFRDIEYALSGGTKEIVLTGVNLGSWGNDLPGSSGLNDLIKNIIKSFDIQRIRLSSIEPWDVDNELLDLLRHPVFCKHLHLPLQSGCDQTLKRMGRRINTNQFRNLVERIWAINKKISITTDIIVGFPGESEYEFNKTVAFIKKIGFSGGHVFRYSPREGTPASTYLNKVQEIVKKDRSKIIRDLIHQSEQKFRKANIGEVVKVLWERSEQQNDHSFKLSGLSENYLPISTNYSENLYNEISKVEITMINGDKVNGRIIN